MVSSRAESVCWLDWSPPLLSSSLHASTQTLSLAPVSTPRRSCLGPAEWSADPSGCVLLSPDLRAPTGPSLACPASEQGEQGNRMEDLGKSDGWDEVPEEDDEMACVHKGPPSASFLSSGTSRRSKSEKKPRFSIRALDVKTENLWIGEQEGTSGVPPAKASETKMAELLENIEEETEDLPLEFSLPTKKANASVSELLEDLQGRSGYSVRAQSSLHQHTPNIAIREQEVSSGVPPVKASKSLVTEPLGNIKEETENLPSEFTCLTKKANISVAELLEDLQGRSGSSVRTASSLHKHARAKGLKTKQPTSEKKTLAIGERSHDSEDPLEHVIDGTSSEEEEAIQNHLSLMSKDVKQQTMTDLFQEVFNPTNKEGTVVPMRSTGADYYGRMQQIMQAEKDRHAEFLRKCNREHGFLGGPQLAIMSLYGCTSSSS